MRMRNTAALATVALGVGSLGVVGSMAQAQAATGTLPYSCPTALGPGVFNTSFDTNAPAKVASGKFATTLTSKVQVDAGLMGTAYGLGARSVEGSAVATLMVAGKPVTVTSAIPRTSIPASGPLALTLTGPLSATLPAGTSQITAGNYVTHLKIYDGSGNPFLLPAVDVTCTAPATGNKVVDTVKARAVTKTTVKAKSAGKGAAKVTVKVKGSKPAGKVKVTLKGPKKTTKVAKVKNGKAVVMVKGLKKGAYKITAAYAGNKTNMPSKGKGKVVIRK